MASPKVHFVVSSLVGLVLRQQTRRILPPLAAFVGGFLIDADHLVDHFLYHRRRHQFQRRLVLPLHGWELVPLFALFERHVVRATAGGFTLGYLIHLLIDQITNPLENVYGYSLLYRASTGFSRDVFGTSREPASHGWRDERSLVGILRWF